MQVNEFRLGTNFTIPGVFTVLLCPPEGQGDISAGLTRKITSGGRFQTAVANSVTKELEKGNDRGPRYRDGSES